MDIENGLGDTSEKKMVGQTERIALARIHYHVRNS